MPCEDQAPPQGLSSEHTERGENLGRKGPQTSSFRKVSKGERATNKAPKKKAGNVGASGTGFHMSPLNLQAEWKTREAPQVPHLLTGHRNSSRVHHGNGLPCWHCPYLGKLLWAEVCSHVSGRRGGMEQLWAFLPIN